MRLTLFLAAVTAAMTMAVFAKSALAADDKIPVTIAAFSTRALAADAFYSNMGEQLKNAPGNPFDVKMLIRGELGSDEAHFYALRRGRIQIAGVGFQSVSTVVPELTIVNGAFLFESWEEVDYVFETAVIPYINALLAEHDIKGIRHYGAGWHGIYSKEPIRLPADAEGKRIRALIDPSSQVFIAALGADMFQLAMTDVVTALQTGLLEAGDTNAHVYTMTGTSTEAPFFTLTRHTPSIITVIANKHWWDRLTPDQQRLVENSHPPMREAGKALRADADRMLAAAADDHATLIEPTAQELSAWRAVGLSTHRALIDTAGGQAQELYDLIIEAKAAFAAEAVQGKETGELE